MPQLLPCPECARHLHPSEPSCPFCHTPVSFARAPGTPEPSRLSRTARMALGAALAAATLPGCAGAPRNAGPPPPPSAAPGAPGSPDDDGAPAPEYGAPAPPPDEPDPGTVAPLYGVPAPEG
ncbi:MAG: hypothetical protein KF718_22025 [Polyangiaceae bacterium]|nr:hypothetical protein [Polyangiaceae bacterium]